jgi:hypothetical protein
MKRITFFLLVLLISRIGTSYAAPNTNPSPIQNFFLSGAKTDRVNINQVLSLIVGPAGKPGPAGKNGIAGPAGRDGAQGPAGPAGANGAPGANGAQGPAGPQGPAGAKGDKGDPGTGGGGGTLFPGQGVVNVIGCASDDAESNVKVVLLHHFDNSIGRRDFFLDGIVLENLPISCARADNDMNLTFSIQDGSPFFRSTTPSLRYNSGQTFECNHTFNSSEYATISGNNPATFNLKMVNADNARYVAGKIQVTNPDDLRINFTCDAPIQDEDSPANSVIGTRDIYGAISFEFGPR